MTALVKNTVLDRWGQRGTAGAAIAARLEFENISLIFDSVPVLNNLSLTIEPGEIVCLLGHSGSGKTSLLRIAAGIERPQSGRVLINGLEMSGPGGYLPPEKRGVGLMFQDYALFPHLSILDNVRFGLKSFSKEDALRASTRALERVGMQSYSNAFPHILSGGQQQRVALARAIAPRPGVLLMDEPFSGLDNRLRDQVRDETIAVLREMRTTSILVTHDPEEAMRMADRIILLRDGHIVQQGSAQDVYFNPVDHFAARFFSEMNELEGFVRNGKAETPLGSFLANGFSEGDRVLVCIRPQACILKPKGEGRPCRIVRRLFLGEVDVLEIAVDGMELPVKARIRDGRAFETGVELGISFDQDELLIFAN
ncbi:MAG: ABC transporter ATP-binding protein [Cohaesibacteraceae bacterium]|nr:ABC transporter ATP-binding protein [Cohaesibacteraceae bacterium]